MFGPMIMIGHRFMSKMTRSSSIQTWRFRHQYTGMRSFVLLGSAHCRSRHHDGLRTRHHPASRFHNLTVKVSSKESWQEECYDDEIRLCEQIIDYTFTNKLYCIKALNASGLFHYMHHGVRHKIVKNVRLAVYGDAIIGTYLCRQWFEQEEFNRGIESSRAGSVIAYSVYQLTEVPQR